MALFYPPSFQGNFRKKNYFEGWYCKHVSPGSANEKPTTLAVIPGISSGKNPHSFIQINLASGSVSSSSSSAGSVPGPGQGTEGESPLETGTGKSWYITYPLNQAILSSRVFDVKIGQSRFSLEGMDLEIDEPGIQVSGKIVYANPREFPVSLGKPGIMGPYRYVPAMECYHGLVSAHHGLQGTVKLQWNSSPNRTVDFTGGEGYIEKDWGRSFPSRWIWMQANSFAPVSEITGPISFMLSVAEIPWMGRSFTGFLGYLYINETYYPFASYTKARVSELKILPETVRGNIESRDLVIDFLAHRDDGAQLTAPISGTMSRSIKESVAATIELQVRMKNGESLPVQTFISGSAGLEVSGEITP